MPALFLEGVDGNELLMMLDVAGFCLFLRFRCKTVTQSHPEVLNRDRLPATWALGSLRVTREWNQRCTG